jgi:hypothetical protein
MNELNPFPPIRMDRPFEIQLEKVHGENYPLSGIKKDFVRSVKHLTGDNYMWKMWKPTYLFLDT